MEVIVIAFAGVAANLRLLQLLRRLSGSAVISRKILFAWLAGNLFLAASSPGFCGHSSVTGAPVEFLRDNAFQGGFYETVFRSVRYLLF